MPFFDDSGPRPEEERGPVFRTFALLRDQLERMMALNLAWALPLAPALASWALVQSVFPIKVLIGAACGILFIPASGVGYQVLWRISSFEPLTLDLVKESWHDQAVRSFTHLLPLYTLIGAMAAMSMISSWMGWLWIDVLAQLGFLLISLCSLYWGAIFVAQPKESPISILRISIRLVWRHPWMSLWVGFLCLAAITLGVVSVGGLFLIVLVLVGLLQIQLYRSITNSQTA